MLNICIYGNVFTSLSMNGRKKWRVSKHQKDNQYFRLCAFFKANTAWYRLSMIQWFLSEQPFNHSRIAANNVFFVSNSGNGGMVHVIGTSFQQGCTSALPCMSEQCDAFCINCLALSLHMVLTFSGDFLQFENTSANAWLQTKIWFFIHFFIHLRENHFVFDDRCLSPQS